MTSPTASITFHCYPSGRVCPDLWADRNAHDAGTLNAIAIERLVRLIMTAPEPVRDMVEAALDAWEKSKP